MSVHAPTRSTTAPLVNASGADIQRVFAAQRETALHLRTSTVEARIGKLKRLRAAIEARRDAIIRAGALDFGKPDIEVEMTELLTVIMEISHTCKHLRTWLKPKRIASTALMLGTRASVRYEPRGRCLIISPWNYPITLTFGPLVPAIASGNTVIIKTSELTPHLSAVMVEIIRSTFDEREVAIFEGDASVASQLLELPFDHSFFTGSPAIGKVVMRAAAEHLTSVTLELGGKSPTIIDATADLDMAVKTITWGKFLNAGQTCIAPDHIYVASSVKARFVSLLKRHLSHVYGEGEQARGAPFARIVNERHASRISGLIDDAVARGAQASYGALADPQARFISPTLLENVPDDTRIMQEEIFGPVLPIIAFDTLDEAIARINQAPKPLALYIWSKDRQAIEHLLNNTSAGASCINHIAGHFLHNNLPFGGVNNSGMGSYHAEWGIRAFSHERAILESRVMLSSLFFPPYTQTTRRILRWLFKFF
ncbi:aldehyde dehydrogenase family protein [Pseudomonas sp. SC11]|uniref:aldehyde dehydrogenase family protein n=1 Tax=Pseudomonas sp. SC11 TaxID=326927 RepID=UPI00399B00FE